MENKTDLSDDEIKRGLPEGWSYSSNALHKSWHFERFMEMPDFVIRAVGLMNELNHHADISMNTKTKTVKVSVTTHSEGRVTRADMQFAEKVNNYIGF